MNNSDFVHLHVHSEYSLLDGLGKPEHYVERAKELGFQALAVTDHWSIDAHLQWQKACQKFGVRSILGCELYLVSDMKSKEKKDPHGHMTVLVKDLSGWQALARMLTVANLEGFYYRPRLDFKTLVSNVNDGLIVMTGCANSFLSMSGGTELLIELGKNKRIDCYLEVMPHQTEDQKRVNELCCDLSQKFDLPLVASNDCHYIQDDHAKAQEVLLAIQRQAKWKDKDRWRFEIDGLYLRTADEMIQAFRDQNALSRTDYYRAMTNTLKVAGKCWDFQLPKKDMDLPLTRYEKEQSEVDASEILRQFCEKRRKEFHATDRWNYEYQSRYIYELELIKRKGFARYFLIVCEIIEWCKKQGIMIGPGRGSVGGSLVAYLLTITQVDPLLYGLLFERFISEDRIDYPDIDLDFEDVKCHLVREHLEQEYGKYNVVGISTFLRMKGRAIVRDVGRVFDLPAVEVDSFAKSIWQGDHEDGIIGLAKDDGREGSYFSKKYSEEFQLMTILEGTIRGAGQHPAGLVLSAKDLREGESCNICQRSEALVCNWDMDNVEYNGLVKIDVLKLGTLTVLNEAKRLLSLQNIKISYEDLLLDDQGVFDMLSCGDTSGVFQFTGSACTELCKRMGIDSFGDMAAITALARPGPAESGMTDLYVRRKRGERWTPLHPVYEAITKETYGVIVYQEQMMRAMTDLAGLSNSDADQIRKVIGKKRDLKEFEPYRNAFLKGCSEKRTLTHEQAEGFWKGLLEWANYGFVKAHAVEYAMIGYWTAFLKLYYPVEFFCAQLTYGVDKGSIVKEVERAGMRIVTPKLGISDGRRWIVKDEKLYMPFIEIKGIGEAQADKCAIKSQYVPSGVSSKGFFHLDRPDRVMKEKGKLEKLLMGVGAFDPDPSIMPKNCLDYFQYPISSQSDTRERIMILNRRAILNLETKACEACGLRKQAHQVILSSLGIYNVLILGEAPGKEEDRKGMGFVGPISPTLWDELARYGIIRRMLHIGNVVKCWPSRDQTPGKKEIEKCFEKWMLPEILSMNCRLILATGNSPLYALTGKDSGISGLSGQTEWIEKVKAHVVWCVHPSSVVRSPKTNTDAFRKAVETFAELFNTYKKL